MESTTRLVCIVVLGFAVHVAISQLNYVGGEFPSCIDIVDIDPVPYSTVLQDQFTVTITFSRSISRNIWTEQLSYLSRPFVFLSWNDHLTEIKGIKPTSISSTGTSWRKVECQFRISPQERRIYRKLHLVVDGSRFVVMDFSFDKLRQTSVSLSIFGEYYLLEDIPNKQSPQDWIPTPFCGPQTPRALPDPYHQEKLNPLEVTVLSNNYLKQYSEKNYTLYLSIAMTGAGTQQVTLPPVVKALYNGVNVSVVIPVGTSLTVTKPAGGWYEIPVASIGPVHEAYEKVYHSNMTRLAPTLAGFYGFTPTASDRFIRESKWYNYMYSNTMMYAQNKYCYWGFDRSLFSTFNMQFYGRATNSYRYKPSGLQRCEPYSRRTKSTGRSGLTYHAIEPGILHMLVQMSQNENKWKAGQSHYKYIVNGQDVTKIAQWNGIPERVINAVKKYSLLIPPIRMSSYYLALDSAIFVPNNQTHQNCNGVQFSSNMTPIEHDPRFCDREFGTCIGLPFASIKRFPVIPPFGIPELAGWTNNASRMPQNVFRNTNLFLHRVQHPMGQHFDKSAVPCGTLTVSHMTDGYTATVYLSAHEGFSVNAHNIPIGGVKIMRSNFGFSGPNICSRTLVLEETLASATTMTVQVRNTEQGGADVTIAMNCSSLLRIHQTSTIKKWIDPDSSSKFKFMMEVSEEALLVERQSHECTLAVMAHVPSTDPEQALMCSYPITTYFGLFQDPCTAEGLPLPMIDLKYFVIPTSQRISTAESLTYFLQSSDVGVDYVFMKAIAVVAKVSHKEEYLLDNIRELRVQCKNKAILMIEEEQLHHIAKLQFRADQDALQPMPLVLDSVLDRQRIYFFAKKEWVARYQSPSEAAPGVEQASLCSIEVVANRPNKLCQNPTVVQAVHVPLVEIDLSAFALQERGQYWYLELLYGPQADSTMLLLLCCIAASVLLFASTILGHGAMLLFNKRLPNAKKLAKLKKQLYRSQVAEKRMWENPQMYLESSKHGPFYTLYNFKCTESLDGDLHALKLAGVLRYNDKELQVLFGHVKNVYVKRSEFLPHGKRKRICKSANQIENHSMNFDLIGGFTHLLLLPARYLLKPNNAHEEYKQELESFYSRQRERIW